MKINITVDFHCIGCKSENVDAETHDGYVKVVCLDCRLKVIMGFMVKEVLNETWP